MSIIRNEFAGECMGVNGRFFNVVTSADGKRIVNQEFKATRRMKKGALLITVNIRFDDSCGNGHSTFAITGETRVPGAPDIESGGCIHDEIAKHFPEFAGLIKWHLVSSDYPLHYVANTVYHAGNRDCWGLLEGETRQIKNGKTGLPCWKLEEDKKLPQYVDADDRPTEVATLRYVPLVRVGEGKERRLDHARSSAVWPDATDAELSVPAEELKATLEARLPGLMAAFRTAMRGCGFLLEVEG